MVISILDGHACAHRAGSFGNSTCAETLGPARTGAKADAAGAADNNDAGEFAICAAAQGGDSVVLHQDGCFGDDFQSFLLNENARYLCRSKITANKFGD
jgi:hypothetical protein